MADSTTPAWIAASAAIAAVYMTQFLAESYRRFKDGAAIAAGLAGELSSYSESLPQMRGFLTAALQAASTGQGKLLKFRKFEKPVDRFFDEVVGKLGLLGPDLAEQVIYVYSNVDAFRVALVMISEGHLEMNDVELVERLKRCREALE